MKEEKLMIVGLKRALSILREAEGDMDFAVWAIEKDIKDLEEASLAD